MPMQISLCFLASCMALSVVACGSSDSPSTGAGGAAGSAGSAAAQAGASGSAGASAGGSSAGSAGSSSAGSSGASSGTGSAACQMYCACHDMNCATTAIPGGMSCTDFCAAMTSDQLGCRQVMCTLVPAQPDNDHCKHSVGIDQCQ